MQTEILWTLDTAVIERRLAAIGAKSRELHSLIRQHDTATELAAERLDERAMRRAELYDSLVRERDELVHRADELLDELLRRSTLVPAAS